MPEEEKISYYLKKSKTLENNFERKIRISILSSFTLNAIEEIFQVPYRYYKKFNGTMYNDGVFVRKCSEIKYSYPLNNILDLDYSIVIPTLRDGYKISESSDSRILMQSSSAKDILSATQDVLNNDIYAYVKNKHDAINWVEKFKNAEIESLAEDEIYNNVDKKNHT